MITRLKQGSRFREQRAEARAVSILHRGRRAAQCAQTSAKLLRERLGLGWHLCIPH